MSFNYGSAEAWDTSTSTLLPAGNHVVTIIKAEMGTTSTQKPQIELEVSNEHGTRRDWLVITDRTVGKIVQLFDAAHAARPQEGEFNPTSGALNESCVARLRDKKVGVVVREEPSLKDPTRMEPRIQGYVEVARVGDDAPIDTRGLTGVGASTSTSADDEDLPF